MIVIFFGAWCSAGADGFVLCFLAYALWKTLQKWQSRAGLRDCPRTILTEFYRVHSADVVLPLADGSKREIRLRCVVRPDRERLCSFNVLGSSSPSGCARPHWLKCSGDFKT
jgi:hypothetical protein